MDDRIGIKAVIGARCISPQGILRDVLPKHMPSGTEIHNFSNGVALPRLPIINGDDSQVGFVWVGGRLKVKINQRVELQKKIIDKLY